MASRKILFQNGCYYSKTSLNFPTKIVVLVTFFSFFLFFYKNIRQIIQKFYNFDAICLILPAHRSKILANQLDKLFGHVLD